jgi:phosphinothricin acetyltransferase
MNIRYAQENDLEDILEIHNQAIRNRMSVGHLNEMSLDEKKEWFLTCTKDKYPIYVAEQNGKVVGWISIKTYRKGRDAFKKTVESDCFVRNDFKGKGIGNKLLQHMLKKAKELGYTRILAIVLDKNIASRKLLEKNDFEQWGFLPEIGEIDGKVFSHVYYGKRL